MKKPLLKKIAIITVIALLSILTACGTGGDTANKNDKTNEETKRKLTIGTEASFRPFEYMEKGEIVGFDIDFIDAVMKEAGYDYEIKNIGWDPLFPSVENEDLDFGLSAISITDERKQTYDFSHPYYESKLMILFPEDKNIKGTEDLKGKKVGVQVSTTGAIAAEKVLGKNNKNVKKYETTAVTLMAMESGDVDAVVTDNTVVSEFLKGNPKAKYTAISDEKNFQSEFYGVMFKKNNPLKEEINTAINTIIENGTYTKIYKEWFDAEPDLDALKAKQQ